MDNSNSTGNNVFEWNYRLPKINGNGKAKTEGTTIKSGVNKTIRRSQKNCKSCSRSRRNSGAVVAREIGMVKTSFLYNKKQSKASYSIFLFKKI